MESPWIGLSYFGLAVASAVFPWMNAEIIVLSLPAVAHSRAALIALVVIATAGQMTGKCIVYCAGRKGDRILPSRLSSTLMKWSERFETRPRRAVALVLVSALTGLPPFFLITLVAGSVKMNLALFLTAGTAGRLVRFGALVTLPQLVLSLLNSGG
jgi:membrane protein YqaA with SNARE-associated domain